MVSEVLNQLVKDLDNQTAAVLQMLPEVKKPKLAIMGDVENSPFLRSVKKKADWFGLKYDLYPSDSRRCFYARPVIYDRETCAPSILDKATDVDKTQFDGMSCVSEAIYLLLKRLDLISGKDIAIVGRGHAVKGLAKALLDEDATVTVAHSKTVCLVEATRRKDVVIYSAPALDKIVAYDTHKLVIDIGGCIPRPGWFCCDYVDNIGKLTVSVLMSRLVCGG